MANKYFLKLNQFEGPLDLLLHLIRAHEIDIFDIDIYLLSSQYLDYLRLIQFDDLSDASEFIQMAATLTEIKSRMLLPRPKIVTDDGEIIEEDPRETLQRRLLEYEKYQKISQYLADLPQLGVDIHSGHEWQRLEEVFADVERPLTGDPLTLVALYEQLLRDLSERKVVRVEAKQHMVTVEEKVEELGGLVDAVKFTMFQSFFAKFESRYELVVYLLATLELVKMKRVKIYQQEIFSPLWIYRYDCERSVLPVSAEGSIGPQPQPQEIN